MSSLFKFKMSEGPVGDNWVKDTVHGNDAGCTVVFLGTVRDNSQGKNVVRLEYQAYPAMVESELTLIADEVRQRHPFLRSAVEHSVGVVGVGECSVALAIAGAHRVEAIAAIEEFMNELKARVPIWKMEVYPDGSVWKGQGS